MDMDEIPIYWKEFMTHGIVYLDYDNISFKRHFVPNVGEDTNKF